MFKNFVSEINLHPKGLFVLFYTELWERFSYYGMRAILVLYIVSSQDAVNPGLGWSNLEALKFYGWYTALVYFACIPGGIISDRLIGKKKSVLYGGFLLCIGHLILAISQIFFFFTGILLIIIGVGLLKPNISSLVGNLYKKSDIKRDQGFTIFYIGINIGAFLSSLMVGFIGEKYGWHYGFSLAGLGMISGQFIYIKGLDDIKEFKQEKTNNKKILSFTKIEIDRIKLLILSFLLIIVFWASFEQAGGLMNLYAFEKTDRIISILNDWQLPASWFQSINPLLIILLGIPISTFWIKRNFSSLFKMSVGIMIMGFGFIFMYFASIEFNKNGISSMYWLFLAYLFHTVGELCASPVVLSFITKLSPLKSLSTIMGIYFATIGLGNKFAGSIGEYSQKFGETETFLGITITCTSFGLIILLFLKKLNNLSHGADK